MTAVEWLQNQYDNCPESFLTQEDFEQAKQMEKQQIIDANSNGWHDGQEVIMNKIKNIEFVANGGDDNGEQYYNETFKK